MLNGNLNRSLENIEMGLVERNACKVNSLTVKNYIRLPVPAYKPSLYKRAKQSHFAELVCDKILPPQFPKSTGSLKSPRLVSTYRVRLLLPP